MKVTLEELEQQIKHHNYLYYVLDNPELTDAQYDELYKNYLKLGGVAQIGASSPRGDKIEHSEPMLSLDKAYDFKEIEHFIRRIYKILKTDIVNFTAEPKIDGLSLALRYENGKLIKALTRGDGYVGEDVTENVMAIEAIPKKLPSIAPSMLEIRGEVYMLHADFIKLNEHRAATDQMLFANPRNAAAGSLRQLDAMVTKKRNLQFFAYGASAINNLAFSTQWDLLQFYEQLGLPINNYTRLCNSLTELKNYFSYIEEERANLGYDIDGLVYKVADFSLQKRLGNNAHAPRWAIAHKFSAERALTEVQNIEIQVGRLGTLTPVARLKPVNIGGVVVTNASLHNEDYIKEKDIRIGDKVVIQRSGDVIPQIVTVDLSKRPLDATIFNFPLRCPVCDSVCIREDNAAAYRCTGGFTCEAQMIETIKHFASKAAFNIVGLGEKQIEFLYNKHYIKDISEIFTLEGKYNALLQEDGFGELSLKNLFDSINSSKTISLDRFIFALGIRYCGEVTAQKLSRYFKSYKNFVNAVQGDELALTPIEGIGPAVIESIISFYKVKQNLLILEKLLTHITILPKKEKLSAKLSNLTIVFTGSLTTMSREEAKILAINEGANVATTISKNVNLVVAGEKAGSKLKKAHELAIKIISEAQWIALLN